MRLARTPVDLRAPGARRSASTRAEVLALARARAERAPLERGRDAVPSRRGRRLPFAGVKFADFSWIGVGPITAKVLRRPRRAPSCTSRPTSPPIACAWSARSRTASPGINRCQFFASFNTSKLSLRLELKHPEGLAVAKRLIAWADICLDSFTAGTMAELGLGYDVARELNPGIIMASTCLMGQTGPAAKLAGYGYHAAAVCGFYEVTGWDDRPPGGPFNAYTDTIAPRFLAATLIAALDHRRRTGEGQYIDQAQMESSLHFLAPELLDVQVTGQNARRAGNDSPDAAPHDAYPCAGDDQWCAIAVETDAQWRALRRALGDPAWARGARARHGGRPPARSASSSTASSPPSPRASRRARSWSSCRPRACRRAWCSARAITSRIRSSPTAASSGRWSTPRWASCRTRATSTASPATTTARASRRPASASTPIQVLQEILGYDDDDIARIVASGALV